MVWGLKPSGYRGRQPLEVIAWKNDFQTVLKPEESSPRGSVHTRIGAT